MSTALDLEVRSGLQARRGSWQRVAAASGVSYSWISKFVNGHIPNPGHATLTKLHTVLSRDEGAPAAPAAQEPTHAERTAA